MRFFFDCLVSIDSYKLSWKLQLKGELQCYSLVFRKLSMLFIDDSYSIVIDYLKVINRIIIDRIDKVVTHLIRYQLGRKSTVDMYYDNRMNNINR